MRGEHRAAYRSAAGPYPGPYPGPHPHACPAQAALAAMGGGRRIDLWCSPPPRELTRATKVAYMGDSSPPSEEV